MAIKIRKIKDVQNEIEQFSEYEIKYFNMEKSYRKLWESYLTEYQELVFSYLEDNNQIIGLVGWIYDKVDKSISLKNAGYKSSDKYSWLMAIAIDENYRGKGLSNQLMDHFIQTSKDDGINVLGLRVEPKNDLAIKVYKKFGFEEYGRTDNSVFMATKI